jgi:chaperone required for assembly of F1-ATPase
MVTIGHTAKKVKRFYKTVDIEEDKHSGSHFVTLDKRRLKSPQGALVISLSRCLNVCLSASDIYD